MCIKKPLEISDLQGDLLRMLLFLPKHILIFRFYEQKKGLLHVQQTLLVWVFIITVPAEFL